VDLHVDSRKNVLQLPIEAIFQKSGEKYVTIIKQDNTFEDTEVKLGLANSTMIEILKGVSAGDEVKIPVIGRPTPGGAPGVPSGGGGGGFH
jgi:Cu(I)/Ag(I) efflux system membrane fusion protein